MFKASVACGFCPHRPSRGSAPSQTGDHVHAENPKRQRQKRCLLETANTCTQKLRTRHCGAGGNRTPVRRRVTVRATTIPENVAQWLPLRRVGRASKAPPQGLSPESAVFHAVSGLSQLSPPLLLPGCGGPTPRAVTGRDDSLQLD